MRPLSRVPGSPLLSLCCLCDSHGCPPAAFPWVSPWNLALGTSLLQLPAPSGSTPLSTLSGLPSATCSLSSSSSFSLLSPCPFLWPLSLSFPAWAQPALGGVLAPGSLPVLLPPFPELQTDLVLSPPLSSASFPLCDLPCSVPLTLCTIDFSSLTGGMTEANGREGTFPRSHSWVSDNHGTFRKSCIRNVLMGE